VIFLWRFPPFRSPAPFCFDMTRYFFGARTVLPEKMICPVIPCDPAISVLALCPWYVNLSLAEMIPFPDHPPVCALCCPLFDLGPHIFRIIYFPFSARTLEFFS